MKLTQNTPKTATQDSSAGFSLVENVVALTIVSIMLTSLYGAFASGFSTIRTSRESQRATQIMLSKLERVRLCSFDQITDTAYNPISFTESFDPKDQAAGNGGVVYSGTFTPTVPAVGSFPETYRTNLLLVTVSVSWTNGALGHTRSMQSYVARDGMEGFVSVGK